MAEAIDNAVNVKPRGPGLGIWAVLLALCVIGMAVLAFAGTEKFIMTTTASGLQYQVLREGEGEHPLATDTVLVHYEGRLADGTVFDSSYARGEPASFPLDHVIPGWTEGVQLMTPGAKYRLIVPPELAYGEAGAGGVIPPNATLTFDVELLAIAPRQ
jgi:FKBP-type peptidyl-prolyl cis-trans isomerase FkpA/FKBP-type peptidyl-prolyl cis-trans isomerase FklB